MKDHPRVCGEKPPFCLILVYLIGSPPRVRGKVISCGFLLRCFGITPACAGKSFGCP